MSEENKATFTSDPEEVLSYWFPEDINNADLETLQREGKRWMHGGTEVDREITERFGDVLEQARRDELDQWADTPRGRLALIIVLDQFSRNVYRGSPLSYTQDDKALKLALEGIDLGMDRELGAMERWFFWLPLGHSEDLDLHERSVLHAEEEAANAPAHLKALYEFGVSQARAACEVIARFGRHPHRNEVLGRTLTPEELEYLRTETPPHLRQPPS
ncbi:MAG TPA: DUF924 family protein [Rubrobacteraceae bacterium]|nr:DUF924 family protein [Rubrobacteraceae bacterium]